MSHARTDDRTTHFQCSFIVFPIHKRIGKIRDTAAKLLEKPTEASARYYRKQVSASLDVQLDKIGINENGRAEHVSEFWQAVDREAAKQREQLFQA